MRDTIIKLKPCPFCGAKVKLSSLDGDGENFAIICNSCKIACAEMGVSGETKEEIIGAWNLREEISALRSALEAAEYRWRLAEIESPEEGQDVIIWVEGGNGSVDGGYIFDGMYTHGVFLLPDGEVSNTTKFWMPRISPRDLSAKKKLEEVEG